MSFLTRLGVAGFAVLLFSFACSHTSSVSYKDSVSKSLQQADLGDVTVAEDRDKNTITLGGKVHSEDAKTRAGDVARAVAGDRIVANEVSVQPVGVESQARDIATNLDEAIEKNYKAALISQGLDKQDIAFNAKNGVLTLKGRVKTSSERQLAEAAASRTPNVQQVVNEIDVKR
jgi:osmotically-inducible protein OsmY